MKREKQPESQEFTGLPLGVVLVRSAPSRGGSKLTVHTFKKFAQTQRQVIRDSLASGGARVRIVRHRKSALRSARSLAALDQRFAGGAIVYDPTGVYSRAQALTDLCERIRGAAGKKADKILFDSWRRTLFVVLNGAAFAGAGNGFRTGVGETLGTVSQAFDAWQKTQTEFKISVRIGFEPPTGAHVIAVDQKSLPSTLTALARRVLHAKAAAGIAALGAAAVATPALAQTIDATGAVSQPNFSVLAQGGFVNMPGFVHDSGWFGAGAEGTLPLGHSFGVQAEGGVGTQSYYGAGGHIFWRDPSWAMLGAVVSFESLSRAEMTRYGAEGQLYLDEITLGARGGYQVGDVRHGGFIRGDVSFYATPDFVLRAGIESSPGMTFGRGQIEFQPAQDMLAGLSLFADGRFGDGGTILAGLKIHFGEAGVSLRDRERHEDPESAINNEFPGEKKVHYTKPPT